MLFNPEAGKTSEQIIEILLRRRPDLRADLDAIVRVSGRSIHEIVEEAKAVFADEMQDPIARAAYHAKMDRREAPYGPDPLLKKGA